MIRFIIPILFFTSTLAGQCTGSSPEWRGSGPNGRWTILGVSDAGAPDYDSLIVYFGGAGYTEDNRNTGYDSIRRYGSDEDIILFELPRDRTYNLFARFLCNGQLSRWSDPLTFTTPTAGPPGYDDPYIFGSSYRGPSYSAGKGYVTTLGATPTLPDSIPACGGAADDDIYLYALARTFPAQRITLTPFGGTDQDLIVELRDDDRSLINCFDRGGDGEPEEFMIISDRWALDDYEIRVYTKGKGGYADFYQESDRVLDDYVSNGTGCVTGAAREMDGEGQGRSTLFRHIVDSTGAVMATVMNTEDVGEVNVSYYKHTGPLRTAGGVPYANRNITIDVERPRGSLELRLYLTEEEVQELIDAGAIDSVQQLTVTAQRSDGCSSEFTQANSGAAVRQADNVFGGYFVDVITSAFPAEFFFHSNTHVLIGNDILPIANNPGCNDLPPLTFDGSGSVGEYVDVVDDRGSVVLGIENTQPLGEVQVSYYRHDGDVRRAEETGSRYAGRNFAVTPTVQPTGPVGVRLYLTFGELSELLGFGVDIDTALLSITKVAQAVCSATFPDVEGREVILRGAGRYGITGFYLDVEVQSFSEFFIHPAAEPLISPTSITMQLDTEWTFSPNPVTNRLVLQCPASLTEVTLTAEVFDINGRHIEAYRLPSGRQRYLDTQTWHRGLYTVIITGGGTRSTIRVVK